MAKPLVSKKRAQSFFYIIFLFMLAFLAFTRSWWPELSLAFGVAICFRNLLLYQWHDLITNAIIFGGIYAYIQFDLRWEVALPVAFIVGAIYVLFREFVIGEQETEVEHEEEINQEIEEDNE